MSIDPEKAIVSILSGSALNEDGVLAYELLAAFHRGFSIVHLKRLLESDNEEAVKCGIWLASELGSHARPLLAVVSTLLTHRAEEVRFDALDSILSCATGGDEEILKKATERLEDRAASVRWKAMDLLGRASNDHIEGALRGIQAAAGTQAAHIDGLRLLLNAQAYTGDLLSMTSDDNAITRKYAVIAIARRTDELLDEDDKLHAATLNRDRDVSQFASGILTLLRKGSLTEGHRWRWGSN